MSSLAFCTRTAVDVSRIHVAFSTSAGHITMSYKLTGYTLLCHNIDYALQCIQTNKKPKKTIPLSVVTMNPNTPPRAVSPPALLVLRHSSKPSTPAKARLHPSQYTRSYGIAVKQSWQRRSGSGGARWRKGTRRKRRMYWSVYLRYE